MIRVIISIFISLTFLAVQSQTKNFIDQPYIKVNGSADTAVTPDEIYIKIVISEGDTKNKVSLEDLELKMVDVLKTLGIGTEKDLTTSDMSSNFKYYFLRGTNVLKTKEYILKVSNAETATKVFMQLEDLGISNTSINKVGNSDLENIKNLMRSKAVENAKARALALTKPLSQTPDAAIYIADSDNYNLNALHEKAEGLVVVTGYGTSRNQQPVLPKIEFQKIEVKTNVNVKFILK